MDDFIFIKYNQILTFIDIICQYNYIFANSIEHHASRDLIEGYKAKHGFSLSNDVLRFSRSELILLSKLEHSSNAKCDALKRNCLCERVLEYWNKLAFDVKMAPNINSFKNRLVRYKSDCIDSKNS